MQTIHHMTVSQRVFGFFHPNGIDSRRQPKAERNAKLVQYFYGILSKEDTPKNSSSWPTLEDTGNLWGGMTRERARQIIHINFVSKVSYKDFPEIMRVVEILNKKTFWQYSDIKKELIKQKLVEKGFSLKGLFNLMGDLGVEHGFHILTPELTPVSRTNYSSYKELFVIHSSILQDVKDAYVTARHIVPRCGVAQVAYTKDPFIDMEMHNILCALLRNHPGVWFYEEGSKAGDGTTLYWYAFENMNNTLISYAEKVFTILKPAKSSRIAEGFHNAMHSRSYEYPYPPARIIELFFQNCRHFTFNKSTGILTFVGRELPMTEIEGAIVRYLIRHKSVKFNEFLAHLVQLSYGKALTKKNITFSPFIFVDRTLGRKSHTYALLSPVKDCFS